MENVKSNKLGERLKTLRGSRPLNQVQQECGIDRGQLRRYEERERLPEDEALLKLASYYEVSFDELKILFFDDLYPEGSHNRALLKKLLCFEAEN